MSTCRLLIATVCLLSCALSSWAAEYKSFNEALNAGSKLARDKQYTEAQVALEAALKLAANDDERLKAWQALVTPYRQLPEITKMLEAQEFIIAHAEQRARRSIAARDVASFLHQRGQLDAAVTRYEAALQKNPRDLVALNILTVIHKNKNDREKSGAFEQRLESVNLELAQKVAEKHEAAAAAATATQAWFWKEAALAWLEANDKARALAAAKKSLAAPPEARSGLLTFYWRNGLGEAFLQAGDAKAAITQFEAAAELAPSKNHRDDVEKKMAEAKAANK